MAAVEDREASRSHSERAEPAGGLGPAQPTLLRDINERVVFDTIRALHPISRAEVARRTGLSKPTVSLAIRTLEASGLVADVGVESGRSGRAGVLVSPVVDAALAVGVEIEVGRVRATIVDLDGQVLAEHGIAVTRRTADALFGSVVSCVDALAGALGRPRSDIGAITVGSPGVIDPATGVLTQAGTLPELDGTTPADELAARLDCAVSVHNDVDLAALGEQAEGHGREADSFVVLWVGSGLGAALVLNGRLHVGYRGGAGEIFDVPFRRAIESSALGSSAPPTTDAGVFDASLAGTTALARHLAPSHPRTALEPPFDALAVLDAASTGDPLGVAVRDRLGRWVAWYAATVTAVIDPELVVLAGPLGSHDALRTAVTAELDYLLAVPPRIATSKLGDSAVLIGASSGACRDAADRAFNHRILERDS